MHRNFYLLILIFAFLALHVPFLTSQNVFSQGYLEKDEKEVRAEKERQKFVKEMQALLEVILPVFIIIGFGYLSVWKNYLSNDSIDGLMRFTQNFLMEAMQN